MPQRRLVKPWSLVVMGFLAGCAGLAEEPSTVVVGRIVTRRSPAPLEEFTFRDRTYQDRRMRVDATGGLADAAVYLEGRETPTWDSGSVSLVFGPQQFDPRISFVSPGRPVEIGDVRDEEKHELVVKLKDLQFKGNDRVLTGPDRKRPAGGPDRVCFSCPDGTWKREGRSHARGRTFEVTFDRPVLVPLDWD